MKSGLELPSHDSQKQKTTLNGGSVWELAEFIPMKSGHELPSNTTNGIKQKTTLKGGSAWELAEFIPMKSGLEQPSNTTNGIKQKPP